MSESTTPPNSFLYSSNFYRGDELKFSLENYYPQNPQYLPRLKNAITKQKVLPGGLIWHYAGVETENGPLSINILEIDMKRSDLELKVIQAENSVVNKGETVSSMADRTNALAGINGDYFHIGTTNEPLNLTITNGELLRLPIDFSTFSVTTDRKIIIDRWKNSSHISTPRDNFPISMLNYSFPREGTFCFYTSVFDSETPKINYPTIAVLLKKVAGTKEKFVVESIVEPGSGVGIREKVPVLVGIGEKSVTLVKDNFKPGMDIAIDLKADGPSSFYNLKEAIGGGPILIKDGNIYEDTPAPAPEERDKLYPVVAAGTIKKDNKLLFVTVDGRQPLLSIGLTRPQFAELMKYLGCDDAIAFDSGGSVTLVARDALTNKVKILNSPSDGQERSVTNGLFVYSKSLRSKPVSIYIEPEEIRLLINSRIELNLTQWDSYGNVSKIDSKELFFKITPSTIGGIEGNYFISGNKEGEGTLLVRYDKFSNTLPIKIYSDCNKIEVKPSFANLDIGEKIKFNVKAFDENGKEIYLQPSDISFSLDSILGSFIGFGNFIAGPKTMSGKITVGVGKKTISIPITVGTIPEKIYRFDKEGVLKFSKSPDSVEGSFQLTNNPKFKDVPSVGLLKYDFSKTGDKISAVYLEGDLAITGKPMGIGVNVFGDNSNHWLRMVYIDANGIDNVVDLVKKIDWQDWRFFSTKIPPNTHFPIKLIKIYCVETNPQNKNAGQLYFADITVLYSPEMK